MSPAAIETMSVPSAPQIVVRPKALDGALHFYWTVPTSDGGSPITGYTLSCTGLSPQSLGASTYDYRYTGLTNGTSYTFSITAENTNGSSPAAVFRTVQPGNLPGVVQNLTASRAAAPAVTLDWDVPASNGGASILGYSIRATSDDVDEPAIQATMPDFQTAYTLGGLTTGNIYRYTVQAVNDPGYSQAATTGLYSLVPSVYDSEITTEWNHWAGITCDSSGEHVLASAGYPGFVLQPIYKSNNFGQGWKQLNGITNKSWNKLAASLDGTKIVASVRTGYIYTSSDSGTTWTEQLNSGSRAWNAVACSSNASVILASTATASTAIYLSTDSGATWTAQSTPGLRTWTGVCVSANGQVLAACASSANIWTSTDGGANWVEQTNSTSRTYNAIACSADGSKLVAVTTAGVILQSTDTGVNWSVVYTVPAAYNTNNSLSAVTMSADGSKIFVSSQNSMFVSTDSGTTWTRRLTEWERFTNWNFVQLACSTNGAVVYAAKAFGSLWRSTDTGATWNKLTAPRTNSFYASCMSSDGTIQYATEFNTLNGYIWKSTDKGVTWNPVGQSSIGGGKFWRFIACSADGVKLIASESTSTGTIWLSTNSGATWTRSEVGGFTTSSWRGVCCDISGTKLAVAVTNGYIYTSDDSGATWTTNSLSSGVRFWRGLACSADRTKLVAAVNTTSSYIYTSVDSGVTWVERQGAGAQNWINVACTPSFSVLLPSVLGGGVYYSTDSGATWTLFSTLPNTSSYNFYGLSISADGTKLAAADLIYGLYISTDSGATWTQESKSTNTGMYTTSTSSDGSIILAPSFYGPGIFTKQLFG